MNETADSDAVAMQEGSQSERITLRLAAGAVADAYQLDYFREYPVGKHNKPSGGERAKAWQKAETNFPQFAERIAELGGAIPGAQEAREVSDYPLRGTFGEIANPLAREFLINIVMGRLGSGLSSYGARDQFVQRGEGEVRRMSEGLTENGFELSSLSPTDVAEAYLDGILTVNPPSGEPPSL